MYTRRHALAAVLVVEHKKETTSFCLFKHATRGPLVKTASTKTCKKGHLKLVNMIIEKSKEVNIQFDSKDIGE